jgi:hypothetical protein
MNSNDIEMDNRLMCRGEIDELEAICEKKMKK